MSLGLTLNEPQINLDSVNSPDQLIYEFQNYRLDAEHLMLYRDDEELSLTPKQVETLLALVEKNGEIVSKDVLMERLWGDTAVEEANLIQNIHFLRKVLEDGTNGKPIIETLRRRGYRFTAKLKDSRNANASASNETIVPPEVGGEWYQQRPIAMTLAALGLLGLVIIAASFLFSSRTAPASGRTQFAVLPLKPIDISNRNDYYEIGVADSLILRLNSIQGFAVRPLSATRKYDSVDQDAIAAGREQRVDHIIASNYQIADGKFRITAQLINVASGITEDTFKVEKPIADLFTLQDEVADEIVQRLVSRFEKTWVATGTKRGTNNEEAYRLYLQGRNLTMMRNSDARKKAIEYFEQAIKLDPSYALAYARMAHAYYGSGLGGDKASDAEKAKELVKKALELDPELAEAYVSRGHISALNDWNLAAAERDFLRAIELDPNNDTAHWEYGVSLAERGLFDEGLREVEAALAIDPGAVMYMLHRGRVLYYARRYPEAISQYQQAMDLDDRFIQPFGWMVRAYETQGDYHTAFNYFLKREARSPRKDRIESYQRAHEAEGWMGVRRELAKSEDGLFDIARLHSLRGETDAAFENLNRSLEKREWLMLTLAVEPAFDNLRNDARFGELLTCVGIK